MNRLILLNIITFCLVIQLPQFSLANATSPLNEKDAKALYKLAEAWLQLGRLPEETSPYPVSQVTGVRVTLRYMGITMGTGDSVMPGWTKDTSVDIKAHLKKALFNALLVAQKRRQNKQLAKQKLNAWKEKEKEKKKDKQLENEADKTPASPKKDKNEKSDMATIKQKITTIEAATFEALKNATLDIQIAGPREEIWIGTGQHIIQHFAYGYHGLVLGMREADTATSETETSTQNARPIQERSRIWPATMLTRNVAPLTQLRLLLKEAGVPADGMRYMGSPDNESYFAARFNVMHLTRTEIGGPVVRLHRGLKPLPGTSVSSATVMSMRERLSQHLVRHIRSDGFFKGTYTPTSDQWETTLASPTSAALALYALHLHWQMLPDNDLSKTRIKNHILSSTKSLIPILLKTMPGNPDDPINPIDKEKSPQAYGQGWVKYEKLLSTQATGRALLLLAILESDLFLDFRSERDQLAKALKDWLVQLAPLSAPLVQAPLDAQATETDPAQLADTEKQKRQLKALLTPRILTLLALARHHKQTGQGDLIDIKKATLEVWQHLNAAQLSQNIGALSWIFRLHQYMTFLKWDIPNPQERRTALIALADKLRQKVIQDTHGTTSIPQDLIGGIPRKNPLPGTLPDADWATAEVLGYLSLCVKTMPNENKDKFYWLIDAGLMGRFVAQLMFDEFSCFYVRNPSLAIGGLRRSLWDNRLSIDASATALISSCELQQAIDQFKVISK